MQTPSRQSVLFGALAVGLLGLGSCEFEEHVYAFPEPTILVIDEITSEEFEVEWAEIFGAEEYLLEISSDAEFSTEVGVVPITTDRLRAKVGANRIDPFQMYYCRVSTFSDTESDSNYSAVSTVQLLPLATPEPEVREDSGRVRPEQEVQWEPIRLVGEYQLQYQAQVSQEPTFQDSAQIAVDQLSEATRVIWTPANPFQESVYFVRVRSVLGTDSSAWSETLRVETAQVFTGCLDEIFNLNDTILHRFTRDDVNISRYTELLLVVSDRSGGGLLPRQSIFFDYSAGQVSGAFVDDIFLGESFWDFYYTDEGMLESFDHYNADLTRYIGGDYFYNDFGLVEEVYLYTAAGGGPLDFDNPEYDTAFVSFVYDQGDAVQQIGPGDVRLTLTYEEGLNPIFWLPQAIQLMLQTTPDIEILGADFSWGTYLSVIPKLRAVQSITDQNGNMLMYDNDISMGQMRSTTSINGTVNFTVINCQE